MKTTTTLMLILSLIAVPVAAQADSLSKNIEAGDAAFRRGNFAEAEQHFRAAVKEAEKSGIQDSRLSESSEGLAVILSMQKRYAQAEKLFIRSLEVNRSIKAPDDKLASSLWNLGQLYVEVDKEDSAVPLLEQALELAEKSKGPEHLLVANILNSLASAYIKQQKYDRAEPICRRALAIYEKSLGPDHWTVAGVLGVYANLLKKMDRKVEASEAENRMKRIRAKNKSSEPFKLP